MSYIWWGHKKPVERNDQKLSVTTFSPEKIIVTITLKNARFLCLKVSGANGDLDIFMDKIKK